MFKSLKQKIADGVEGVSPGRQTPLSGSKESVGKAQAQNNGIIGASESSLEAAQSSARPGSSTPRKSLEHVTVQKLDSDSSVRPVGESTPTHTPTPASMPSPTSSTPASTPLWRQRRSSTSSNVSAAGDERSDAESDLDSLSRADPLSTSDFKELYRKQGQTLERYKAKFSEVVSAYKALQKDKEKLETTLSSGQDKQLRRINELKEVIELEQQGKRHLEETLRLNLEEKDEQISVLQTQVQILKSKFGVSSPDSADVDLSSNFAIVNGDADHVNNAAVDRLQAEVNDLNAELAQLKMKNNQVLATAARTEQEKHTAISDFMQRLQAGIAEQDELKSELALMKDELNRRDDFILKLREEARLAEAKTRESLYKELRGEVLSEAMAVQEKELKDLYQRKEEDLKNAFASKVHDLQRILEENEKQKEIAVNNNKADITRLQDQILVLNEQLEQLNEREAKSKNRIQKLVGEKDGVEKKLIEANQRIEQEQAKLNEIVQQHNRQLKEKQDEMLEQGKKLKQSAFAKVQELQELLKTKDQQLADVQVQSKKDLEAKTKEMEQVKQSELAKASRKFETKMADLKNMIKELRGKLEESDRKHSEMQRNFDEQQNHAQVLSQEYVRREKELEVQLMNSSASVDMENSKLSELRQEVDLKCREIEVLESKQAELTTELSDCKRSCDCLASELARSKSSCAQLEKALAEAENELHNQVAALKSAADENEKCIVAKCEIRLRELQARLEQDAMSFSKQREEFEQGIDDLTDRLAEERRSFGVTKQEGEEQVKQLQAKLEFDSAAVSKWRDMSADLQKQLDSAAFALSAEQVRADHLSSEIRRLQLEVSARESKIVEKEEHGKLQIDLLNCKLSELESKCVDLSSQLREKGEKIRDSHIITDQLQAKLRDQADEFALALHRERAESARLSAEVTSLKEERLGAEKAFSEKVSALEESKRLAISQMERDFEAALSKKDAEMRQKMTEVVEHKDSSLSSMSAELEKMRKQELDQAVERYENRLRQTVKEWEIKVEELQQTHSKDVASLEENMAKFARDSEGTISSLQQQILAINSERRSELSALNEEKNALDGEKQELSARLADAEKLLCNFQAAVTESERERIAAHNQEIAQLRAEMKCQVAELVTKHQQDLEHCKSILERSLQDKTSDMNLLQTKSEEERNRLVDELVVAKDKLARLGIMLADERKDKENLVSAKQALLTQFELAHNDLQVKVLDLERKHTEAAEAAECHVKGQIEAVERKYKKIIAERDKKSKALAEASVKDSEEKMDSMKKFYEDEISEYADKLKVAVLEKDTRIADMTATIQELHRKYADAEICYRGELETHKSRENEVRVQLEEVRGELLRSIEKYEDQIEAMSKEYRLSRAHVEELEVRLLSGESSAKEVNERFSKIMHEKTDLEDQLSASRSASSDKIRELENLLTASKEYYESQLRELADSQAEISRAADKHREKEILDRISVAEEETQARLAEMKKKAELRISKLKRELSDKTASSEAKICELNEKVKQLEKLLEDNAQSHEQVVLGIQESHRNELEHNISRIAAEEEHKSKVLDLQMRDLQEQLKSKSERISALEMAAELATVDKMNALKMQKADLAEEHSAALQRVRDEAEKRISALELKLNAKVEEKEFEYSAKVKQMVKEWQAQLSSKDRDIQEAVENAMEAAQRDERKVVAEYDAQIVYLRKELRHREDDLIELRDESDRQIDLLHDQIEGLEKNYQLKLSQLEQEYQSKLGEIVMRHEEELRDASKKDPDADDMVSKHERQMNEIEQTYVAKIREVEEEKAALERKLKLQIRKAKTEMRKLLSEKTSKASLPGADDLDASGSNPGSDSEPDQNDARNLREKVALLSKELTYLREREKLLTLQAEQASTPKVSTKSIPAKLNLNDSAHGLNEAAVSPPKSPQPIEFEYLRNILFQYMTGKQRKQMAKVLTAIVHFTPSQVQQIMAREEQNESQSERSKSWL